jgi:hypothetical protein
VLDYIKLVRELNLGEEVESRLLWENPARFLGSVLECDAAGARSRGVCRSSCNRGR